MATTRKGYIFTRRRKDSATGAIVPIKDNLGRIDRRYNPEDVPIIFDEFDQVIVPSDEVLQCWPRYFGENGEPTADCGPIDQPVQITWTAGDIVVFEPLEPDTPTPQFYVRSAVDVNDCEKITWWAYDSDVYPAVAEVRVDGITVATVASSGNPRPDVQQYLATQGITTSNTIFNGIYYKPSQYRDGQEHIWQVFVRGVEAFQYNAPKAKTCDAPVDNTPYVRFVKQSLIYSVNKGGNSKTVSLIEVLSDGNERPYSGDLVPVWSVANNPSGIFINPYNQTKTVDVVAFNDASVDSFILQCSLAQPQTVQVLTTACTRPSGLTNFKVSYHFVPNGGDSLPPYPTLDDANTTAGKAFDGTVPGNLDLFDMQSKDLNVGTEVFYLIKPDCEHVGDNIYYVTDSSGGNTVKKAIQVRNGVIVAVKDSSYTTQPTVTLDHYEIVGGNVITEGGPEQYYYVQEVYNNGSRKTYNPAGGIFSLQTPYPDGTTITWLSGNLSVAVKVPSGSLTDNVNGTLYFDPANNAFPRIQKTIYFVNVNDPNPLPPGTGGCTGYAKATPEQYESYEIITIVEYNLGNYYGRAFNSRSEAITGMQSMASGGSIGVFDRQRASTSGATIGGVLYGNNYPPDSDYNKWPAEAGWWGMYVYITASQIQKYLLQTDACGNIITKELFNG